MIVGGLDKWLFAVKFPQLHASPAVPRMNGSINSRQQYEVVNFPVSQGPRTLSQFTLGSSSGFSTRRGRFDSSLSSKGGWSSCCDGALAVGGRGGGGGGGGER